MEEYKGKFKSLEEAKWAAVLPVLKMLGVDIREQFGVIEIFKDNICIATIDLSTPIKQ